MQHRDKNKESKTEHKEEKKPESTLPDEFDCPLTGRLFENPVVANSGKSYSRETIENYIDFRQSKNLDCKEPYDQKFDLTKAALLPNHALKLALEEYQFLDADGIKKLYIQTATEWLRMHDGVRHTKRLQKTVWPFAFICPLSLRFFTDPVITSEGHTYERDAIVNVILRQSTHPFFQKPIGNQFIPNLILKEVMAEFDFKPLQTENFFRLLRAIRQRLYKNLRVKQQEEKQQQEAQKKREIKSQLFKLVRLGAGVATIGYLTHSCYNIIQENNTEKAFQLEQLHSPHLLTAPSEVAFIGKELLKPLVLSAISCFKTPISSWPDCGMQNTFKNDLKQCPTKADPSLNCGRILGMAIVDRRFDHVHTAFDLVKAGKFDFTYFLMQLSLAITTNDHSVIRFLGMVDTAILKRATGLLPTVVNLQREKIFEVLLQYDVRLDDALENPFESRHDFVWPAGIWRDDIHSGSGAMHLAVWHNRISWIKLLAEKGADINLQLPRGGGPTPLGRAVAWDRADAIDTLISLNAEPIYALNYPISHYAFEHGKIAFLTKYVHLFHDQLALMERNHFEIYALNNFRNGKTYVVNMLIKHALTPQTMLRLYVVIGETIERGNVLDTPALVEKLNTFTPTLVANPLIDALNIAVDRVHKLKSSDYKPSDRFQTSSTLLFHAKNTIRDLMQAFIPVFKQQLSTKDSVNLVIRLMGTDLDLLDTFLSVGAPIHDAENNVSALHKAARENRLDALNVILKHNPDFSADQHATLFNDVIHMSHEKEVVQLILSVKNQSLTEELAKGKYERYLLSLIERNEGEPLDLFLKAGATPHGTHKHYTLLEAAILQYQQSGDNRTLRHLVGSGADIGGLRKLYLSDVATYTSLTTSTKEIGLFKCPVDEKIYLAAQKAKKALQAIDDAFIYKPSAQHTVSRLSLI